MKGELGLERKGPLASLATSQSLSAVAKVT